MFSFDEITKVDPEVAAAMTDEFNRQNNNLELIASGEYRIKGGYGSHGQPSHQQVCRGISW